MSGGGDLDSLRTRFSEDPILLAPFGRCTEVMWFMRFSVPRQITRHSGHLCRLCGNCVGLDNVGGDCFDSIDLELKCDPFELNPFCFRWVIRCFLSVLISRNGRLHSGQENGFSPVWIITWRFRFELLPKVLSQNLQTNAFLLLVSLRGSARSSASDSWYILAAASCLSQAIHFVECRLVGGYRLHTEHLVTVSLLWTFLCFLKSLCSRKRRLQMSHSNGFSPARKKKTTKQSLNYIPEPWQLRFCLHHLFFFITSVNHHMTFEIITTG